MGTRDNTPDIHALGSNQMLFNASDPLQSLTSVHFSYKNIQRTHLQFKSAFMNDKT